MSWQLPIFREKVPQTLYGWDLEHSLPNLMVFIVKSSLCALLKAHDLGFSVSSCPVDVQLSVPLCEGGIVFNRQFKVEYLKYC